MGWQWESGPYTSTGQNSKTTPEGIGVGELTPPLLITSKGELARAMLKNSPWCWRQGRAGADQLTNYLDPEPGLIVGPPQHPSPLQPAGRGGGLVDPGLQDLHSTEQQRDVQEESLWESSVSSVAETRGL